MPTISKYLASIGRPEGLKSRRALDPETAWRIVLIREAPQGLSALPPGVFLVA